MFANGERVELIDGCLVKKLTKNPAHRAATLLIRNAIDAVLPAGWYVDSREPITLATSKPEPDLSVVRGETTDYLDRHPRAVDVAMIGEVSDTTLEQDRGVKRSVYAAAAIPVYWIINLFDRRIEVYTDPTGPADSPDYRRCATYSAGEKVPVVIDGNEMAQVAVDDVLPQASPDPSP